MPCMSFNQIVLHGYFGTWPLEKTAVRRWVNRGMHNNAGSAVADGVKGNWGELSRSDLALFTSDSG